MKAGTATTCLFVNIGGVLLSNDWDHRARNIENTPMFAEVGERVGIRSLLYTDFRSTRAKLAAFGLRDDEGVGHDAR